MIMYDGIPPPPMDYSALEWQRWYAWYPRRTIDGKWVWRKTVERRYPDFYYVFTWDSPPHPVYGWSVIREIP